jgi:sec-independent protein translocase protein TatC
VKFFGRERKGAEGDAAQMTLMDHLRELRNRLIKSVIVIVLGGIVCYVFYDQIFRLAIHPYCIAVQGTKHDCQLYLPDLLNGFLLRMKVATYGGLIVALPVILWQLWRFIMPALYKKERRWAISFVGSSVLLFALGAVLAYYTLPAMYQWLASNSGPTDQLVVIQSADRYFWLSAMMMLGFGIGFEFPIILVALQLVGILDTSTLAHFRRQAVVIIVVVVAVITPGGDPISLIALSVPMYLFYELSILIGWLVNRRKAKAVAPTPAEAT